MRSFFGFEFGLFVFMAHSIEYVHFYFHFGHYINFTLLQILLTLFIIYGKATT
jgi:hypothetical protein